MEKRLIIIKPKSLSAKDKEKLTKAGNIVIEHENSIEIAYKEFISSGDSYVFINCARCGDRIYMLAERQTTLIKNGFTFYCSHGHQNSFQKP